MSETTDHQSGDPTHFVAKLFGMGALYALQAAETIASDTSPGLGCLQSWQHRPAETLVAGVSDITARGLL